MKTIFTPLAPKPAGHYSQAVLHERTVYVSGQLPINPENGEKELGSIEEQTYRVLKNIQAILISSGSGVDKLIKVSIYISDIELWDRVNHVYTGFMGDHKPARVVVPVKDLHFGFKIEMDAIAALRV